MSPQAPPGHGGEPGQPHSAETGLVVTVGSEVKGIIGDREFADLVFGIWLGANPPSGDLKKGLLGG